MKNKKLVLYFIASILLVFAFIAPFLTTFEFVVGSDTSTTILDSFKIFGDYEFASNRYSLINEELNTFWMQLDSILVIIMMVLAVAFILLFILKLLKVKMGSTKIIEKVLAVAILSVSLLIFVAVTLVTIVNHKEYNNGEYFIEIAGATGSFIQMICVPAGIVAMLGAFKKGK